MRDPYRDDRDELMDLRDVAQAIGQSYDWMTRKANRKELYKRGFPAPINRPGRKKWNAAKVRAWRDADTKDTPTRSNTDPKIVNLSAERKRLRDALKRAG